ncbi:MAG: T9SS type A sorting domain-containing protein [Candidatus Marinimicrobia bacterium]|nr:T9SS type A sorting domain-containing protein [Candidatus Neomarinimicrobiota bacterium]MCF7840775.1 T9SS type A sorting domain-containing protein [Candidatus Neomarinimicrobiota bacterium]
MMVRFRSLLLSFLWLLLLTTISFAQDTARVYLSTEDVVQSGEDFFLDVNLENNMAVRGVEFYLTPSPNLLTFLESDTTNRTAGFALADTVYNDTSLRIILSDFGGADIMPGNGPIIRLKYNVDPTAIGAIEMNFSGVMVTGAGSVNYPVIIENLTLDVYTPISQPPVASPAGYDLLSNYPNPFNPATHIRMNLLQPQSGVLTIYSVAGKPVTELHRGQFPAGGLEFSWNGMNRFGEPVPSGIYFCHFQGHLTTLQHKLILLR